MTRGGNTKPRAGVGGKGADNNNDLTSDENEAPSPKRLKGRARETDAARAAAEEVAALEAEDDANQAKKKILNLLRKKLLLINPP